MTTTAPTTGPTPAEAYVEAVAKALSGVAEQERTELLEDLAGHLAELEAEDGDALESRLGPPATYAADLVASAGIEVPTPQGDRSLRSKVGGWIDGFRALASGPQGRAARAFAAELRPGWWIARAWFAMALLTILSGDESVYPLPDLLANDLLSLVALGGAVALSVRIGRLGGRLEWAATAVGVLGVLWALSDAGNEGRVVYYGSYDAAPSEQLTGPDGRVITNVWPFDGQGRPLDGVFLFDQDGAPIDLGPHVGQAAAGHVAIPGLFPQQQEADVYDEVTGGGTVPVLAPRVSIPRLPEGTAGSTTVPEGDTTPAPEEDPSTTGAAPPTEAPVEEPQGAVTTVALPPG